MSSRFSAALKLTDLNDFIAPSQNCVVSLNGRRKDDDDGGGNEVRFQKRRASKFDQTNAPSQINEPVKVTLHDCLACSGCITSAETVMLQQQSIDEFLKQVTSNKAVFVSLSPQSRASLAAYYGTTPLQAFQKLTGFLKSVGVRAVFDTSCSRDLSLMESCQEFVQRYKRQRSPTESQHGRHLPMLGSACPGWICYAEKTLDANILPYISSVKSPQQAMGSIIKHYACHKMGILPQDVYHATIMPCYDKKLEASRDDFLFSIEPEGRSSEEAAAVRLTEVDCVLTSGEILNLLQTQNIDFLSLQEAPLDKLLTNVDEKGHLYGVAGGSGGYAETILRYAAHVLFEKELNVPLEFKSLRNSDFKEVTLEVGGEIVLRFVCCYGFRNIQNLVRKIKAGKCEYHFVEVMACPSGCLNGGGQLKPKKGQSVKDLIQTLESTYLREVDVRDPFQNPVAKGLYSDWLVHPGSTKSLDFMHTGYHHREKSVSAQISNW